MILKEFMFYAFGLLLQDPMDSILYSCSLFFFLMIFLLSSYALDFLKNVFKTHF